MKTFIIITPVFFALVAAASSSLTCSTNEDKSNENASSSSSSSSPSSCISWRLDKVPLEHRNFSCNRALQNQAWNDAHKEAEAAPPEELIPPNVYLRLPEEKTWTCPLDTADAVSPTTQASSSSGFFPHRTVDEHPTSGHPTRWVLYNKASTPIILTHINALGLEVSASDGSYPSHTNTAVYPHGPIVLPGQMAVINGVQGHIFYAREYHEMVFSSFNPTAAEENDDSISWKNAGVESFKKSLPRTLSILSHQSRYETTNGGVTHVLGYPGRVLMKHRMGLIYVKNDSGALCPESWGLERNGAQDDGRRGNPRDSSPLCNVLRKGFINKVGCPIDIYFAPTNMDGEPSMDCEKFTSHLGPIDDFLTAKNQNLDVHNSPLKFENTYNGHSFVARMSHDQSFVARIEIDHDIVRDCPEPSRRSSSIEVHVDESIMMNTPMMNNVNVTTYSIGVLGDNATILAPKLEEKRLEGKRSWNVHNHSGIKASLHHIAT